MLPESHPLYQSFLLLSALFKAADARWWVEFRFISREGGPVKTEWLRVEQLADGFEFLVPHIQKMNDDGYDCYFGVNPRVLKPKTGAGTNDIVSHGCSVWLDIDRDDAVTILKAADPLPSAVVKTGSVGHAQAYWFFDAPVPIESAVALTNKYVGRYHGDNTSDPARVFRLPGTMNLKHPEGQISELIALDEDARIQNVETAIEQEQAKPKTVEDLLRSGAVSFEIVQIIREGHSVAPIDPEKGRVDKSKLDFRVAAELFVAGATEDMVRDVFTNPMYKISAHYLEEEKQKANGTNYIERTIEAARSRADNEINRSIIQDKELVIFDVARLKDIPPVQWLVRPIIAMNSLTIVAGEQKVGKSLGVLDLALMLAAGHHDKWLDRYEVASQKRVLICTSETGEATLKTRMVAIANSRGIDWLGLSGRLFYQHVPFTLTNYEIQNAMIRALEKHKIEVLIIDPLNRYHLSNENDAKDMTMLLQGLDKVARSAGVVSTILVHHFNKPSGDNPKIGAHQLRGSTVLASWGSTYILCSRRESFGGKTYVRFSFELREAETPMPFSMELDSMTLRFRDYSIETERVMQTLAIVRQLPAAANEEIVSRLTENKIVSNKTEAQNLIQRAKRIMTDQKDVEQKIDGTAEEAGPDVGPDTSTT